jgi:hypothetical protein
VNTQSNNIAFRLPDDHLRALSQAAAKHGKSKGRLAKEIITLALMDFSRFDSLDIRLSAIERALDHLIGRIDGVDSVQEDVGQLRASMAMSFTRLLVEAGGTEMSEAVAWAKETFNVKEEP